MEEERAMKFVRGNLAKEAAKIAVVADSSGFSRMHQLTMYKLIASLSACVAKIRTLTTGPEAYCCAISFTLESEKKASYENQH